MSTPESHSRSASETVELIIPTWNRGALLRRALESLRDQNTAVSVCVVDNGSADGTATMIRAEFPEIRLIELGSNLGFGAAVNRAVGSSDAELVALMNNDAMAGPGFVAELASARAATGSVMVAGCMVDESGVVESAGVTADRSLVAYDYLHGESHAEVVASSPAPPLGPSGGAALYERAAFLGAGGFDEEIFAYLEDLDLALRLRLNGGDCVLAPEAYVVHQHSATLGSGSSAKNKLLTRNRRYILWKYERNLGARARLRGAVIDFGVLAGRIVIDRNVGAPKGWLEARRAYRGPRKTPPGCDFGDLPLIELSTAAALRRRRRRRR